MAQYAGAVLFEDDEVFYAHATPAGQVDAWFDREHHARLEYLITA